MDKLVSQTLWIVSVNGSATRKHSEARVVVTTPEGQELEYAIRMGFKTTNNKAEYEVVITGLAIAWKLGAQNIKVRNDSKVITGQI